MRRFIPLVGAAAVIMAAACQPAPPVADQTLIVGDSVTWQIELIGGDSLNAADWLNAPGVTATHPFINNGVNDRIYNAQRAPEVVVYALGLNDASPPSGWDAQDFDAMNAIFDRLHDDTCLVVVLPGVGPQVTGAYRAEVNEARVAMYLSAVSRGAVTADWQPIVDADPSLLRADGIHLRDDPRGVERADIAAARVRRGLYARGVAQC